VSSLGLCAWAVFLDCVHGLCACMDCCGAGEADDRLGTLDLPGSQLPLLQALQAAAPDTPIVLVLLNGGPLSSPWAYSNAQAVLEAWCVECVCVLCR
jgi:hypothetical protein